MCACIWPRHRFVHILCIRRHISAIDDHGKSDVWLHTNKRWFCQRMAASIENWKKREQKTRTKRFTTDGDECVPKSVAKHTPHLLSFFCRRFFHSFFVSVQQSASMQSSCRQNNSRRLYGKLIRIHFFSLIPANAVIAFSFSLFLTSSLRVCVCTNMRRVLSRQWPLWNAR